MDPISSIKVSGTSYEVKDSTARSAIVTLNNELNDKLDKLPLYTKEYDYTCSANDTNSGYLFFGNIIPTSEKAGETWYIHYKLYVDLQSTNSTYQAYNKYCTGVYDCYVGCSGNSIIYACLNRQFSTSYRPIYYHLLAYYTTTTENGTSVNWETKYANRETNPIKVGFRVQSAYRVTDPRHYKVEVYEIYNCSFSFIDPFEKYGDIYTTAKYGACTTISADSGLQESGDANDTTSAVLAYSLLRAGTNGIKMYSLIMEDKDGNWQSFYTGTGSTAVSKTVNPAQFRLGSKVYYVNRSSDLAANSTLGTSQVYTHKTLIDFRYSFPNITSNNSATGGNVGLTAYKPLYILGSIDNDGYFVLDTTKWWTLDEPTTEDNKIYIRVCDAVYLDSANNLLGQYRGDLIDNGTPYWFKDGIFQPYYKASSGGDTNVIETVKVNNTALTPDANKAVNIDLSGYDKVPLVIEVDDTDTTVPSGTYANITTALAAGRRVICQIANYNDGEGEILISQQLIDYSSIDNSYVFVFSAYLYVKTFIIKSNDTCINDTTYLSYEEHRHGYIDSDGHLGNSDETISNGDKLVIADVSDSNKIRKTSIAFDGSTTTKALTPKGTWETFAKVNGDASQSFTAGTIDIVDNEGQISIYNAYDSGPDESTLVFTDNSWGGELTYTFDTSGETKTIATTDDIPSLSKGTTTGNGNAVTDVSVSGHQITLTKGKTFLESETDPVFSASAAAGITSSDITNWNNKTSNTGTITSVKMNGNTIASSGEADLGTVITSHLGIKTLKTDNTSAQTASSSEAIAGSGTINLHKVAKTGTYNDLIGLPTIPTESTVSGWGFTKNTGTYSKPNGGIPYSDLEGTVQYALDKAAISVCGATLDSVELEIDDAGRINLDGILYPIDYAVLEYTAYDENEDEEIDTNEGLHPQIRNLTQLDYGAAMPYFIPTTVGETAIGSVFVVLDEYYSRYHPAGYLETGPRYVQDICIVEFKTTSRTTNYMYEYNYGLEVTEYLLFGKKKRTVGYLWDNTEFQNIIDFSNVSWTDYNYIPKNTSDLTNDSGFLTSSGFKTINNESIVGTGNITVSGGGSGDVTGPSSSTDEAVARFDSTTGKVIQNSVVTIDDSGNIFFPIATSTTFSNNAKIVLGNAWFGSNPSGGLSYGTRSGSTYSGKFVFESTGLRPVSSASGAVDIGTSSYKWRDIYMTGALKTGTYTLSIPSQSGTIAVTTDIPTAITIHTGTSTPSSSLGSNGDIYIKTSS